MSNVFIEATEDGYRAIQNKQVITTGKTQKVTGEKAHNLRPNDTVLAERQITTSKGKPDKWRHLHGPKKDQVKRSGK